MPELGIEFDATEIDPSDPFEILPAGEYEAMLTESEIKTTKDGLGTYLELQFEVTRGEHEGRKLWDRLCLFHQDEQTQSIAKRRLSALCHATGKLSISTSEELHEIPVLIKVKIRPAKDGYDASNEIRSYRPVGSTARSAAGGPVRPPIKSGAGSASASTARGGVPARLKPVNGNAIEEFDDAIPF